MTQTNQARGRSTAIITEAGITKVIYHKTVVVAFDATRIILSSGGYETVTTKRRMNQASNQSGLGYSVSQENYKWYVRYKGRKIAFTDATILDR